jgi:hypothetical protein
MSEYENFTQSPIRPRETSNKKLIRIGLACPDSYRDGSTFCLDAKSGKRGDDPIEVDCTMSS